MTIAQFPLKALYTTFSLGLVIFLVGYLGNTIEERGLINSVYLRNVDNIKLLSNNTSNDFIKKHQLQNVCIYKSNNNIEEVSNFDSIIKSDSISKNMVFFYEMNNFNIRNYKNNNAIENIGGYVDDTFYCIYNDTGNKNSNSDVENIKYTIKRGDIKNAIIIGDKEFPLKSDKIKKTRDIQSNTVDIKVIYL